MLLFYSKVENPKPEDKKRFERIKKRIGIVFKKMKKEKNEKEDLKMEMGENYLAIFQFLI